VAQRLNPGGRIYLPVPFQDCQNACPNSIRLPWRRSGIWGDPLSEAVMEIERTVQSYALGVVNTIDQKLREFVQSKRADAEI